MIKNNKRGFNLIEIAIVLAVIGLVIGGIYVAASAVTENNRKQNTQKQLLTIVQNIRAVYATQSSFSATDTSPFPLTKQVFPADMNVTAAFSGTNNYGSQTSVAAANGGLQFTVTFNGISQGACIDLLSKAFGSNTATAQIGLVDAGAGGTTAVTASGITPASAATVCSSAGNANNAYFTFNLRG